MTTVNEISVEEAKKELDQGEACFLDIRDSASYEAGHIKGAILLDGSNISSYIQHADKQKTHIVYCYHGNSSRPAASFLEQNGFTSVYSMTGGYTDWDSQD